MTKRGVLMMGLLGLGWILSLLATVGTVLYMLFTMSTSIIKYSAFSFLFFIAINEVMNSLEKDLKDIEKK